jgi:hypothetical protein
VATMSERERLNTAYLATASRLMAAQNRREEIEQTEIFYQSDAHPLLLAGVTFETLARLLSENKVPQGMKGIFRRLRHPEQEDAIRAEVIRLDAVIAEAKELKFSIERELQEAA